MSFGEEIAKLEAEISRLKRESKQERDYMIGASYHAISTVMSQWEDFGYVEALNWAQRQSGLPTGRNANGSYRTMRIEIRDMLVRLDLLDPGTSQFKMAP